jgi:hypothetical protein
MATYHNEKTLSEIVLVNCFNKITANGIRTAEQLRQTEYYQEAIEAIYNFVRDAALKTKKSKDMLKASGLEADDVAVGFVLEYMEKDSKIDGLLKCRDAGHSKWLWRCLANYLVDLTRHGTRKTKDAEKIVTAIDDQTLELVSAEMEANPVGCEMIEFVLQNVNFSPAEKLCGLLFLDNSFGELMAVYNNSAQSVEAFVEELVCEAKAIYGINVSDAEERGVVRMLKNAADPRKAILLARHRARKKVLNVFEKRRSLKLKKVS